MGTQLPTLSHPFGSLPPQHINSPGPHFIGQLTGHSIPSLPKGPPFVGIQNSGSSQLFQFLPPGQLISSGPLHFIGQWDVHSIPSSPILGLLLGQQKSGILHPWPSTPPLQGIISSLQSAGPASGH